MLYQALRHPQAYPRKPASSSSLCRSYAATRRLQQLTLWGRAPRSSRLRAFQCLALKTGLKVVFVTTEVAPWSKSGGLADVLSGLAAALAARGHRVMTVSPKYAGYQDALDSGARALVSIGTHSQLLQEAIPATNAVAQQPSLEPASQAGTIRDGIVVPLTSQIMNRNAAPIPSSTQQYSADQTSSAAQSSNTSAGLGKLTGTQGQDSGGLIPSHVKLYTANKGDGVQYVFVDHPVFQDAIGAASSVYTYTGGGDGWDIQTRYSILCQAALAAPVLLWPDTQQGGLSPEERKELSALQEELLCLQNQQQGNNNNNNNNNVNQALVQQPAGALGLRHGVARSVHAIESAKKLLSKTEPAIAGTVGTIASQPAVKGFESTAYHQQGLQEQHRSLSSNNSKINDNRSFQTHVTDLQCDEPVIFVGNDWPAGLLAVWHKAGLEMAENESKLLETLSQYKQRMTAFDSWLDSNQLQARTVQPNSSPLGDASMMSAQARADNFATMQTPSSTQIDRLCSGLTPRDNSYTGQVLTATNSKLEGPTEGGSRPANAITASRHNTPSVSKRNDSNGGSGGSEAASPNSKNSLQRTPTGTADSAVLNASRSARRQDGNSVANSIQGDVSPASCTDYNEQQAAVGTTLNEQLSDNNQTSVPNPNNNPGLHEDGEPPSLQPEQQQANELEGTLHASGSAVSGSDTLAMSLPIKSEMKGSSEQVRDDDSDAAGLSQDKLCVFLRLIASCLRNAKFVMTIHNMAFQGLFNASTLPATGLPATATTLDALLTITEPQPGSGTVPLPRTQNDSLDASTTATPLGAGTDSLEQSQAASLFDSSTTLSDSDMLEINDLASSYSGLTGYDSDTSQQSSNVELLDDSLQFGPNAAVTVDAPDGSRPASPSTTSFTSNDSMLAVVPETSRAPKPCISWLQAALLTNDLILTVSPQYADELMMQAQHAVAPQHQGPSQATNNDDSAADAATNIDSAAAAAAATSSALPFASALPGLPVSVKTSTETAAPQQPSSTAKQQTTSTPTVPILDPLFTGSPINHHTQRLMQALQQKGITGIMNGIDTTVWNPSTDPLLPRRIRYGVHNVKEKKAAAKALLQARLRLDLDPEAPLIAYIGRLEEQKGADVILAALPELLGPSKRTVTDPRLNSTAKGATNISAGSGYRLGKEFSKLFSAAQMNRKQRLFVDKKLQVVMLGAGQQWLGQCLGQLSVGWPGKAVGHGGFNEPLAHLIMAAADFLLVPSRFEPCGLVAMCAVRYGTIPIVSPVGGLPQAINATLTQPVAPDSTENSEQERLAAARVVMQARKQLGFLLQRAPPPTTDRAGHRAAVFDLVSTIKNVCELYGTEEFQAMQKRCLEHDVSWSSSVEAWEQALTALISKETAKEPDTEP